MTRTADRSHRPRRWTAAVTAVLHLLALWLYLLSGLVGAGWTYVALLGLWLLVGIGAVLVHRRWGALSAVVPLLAVLTWFGVITLGGAVFGWTA